MESKTTERADATEPPLARRARIAVWIGLILAWGVSVAYMWDAVTAIPSADRLAESRLIVIPGARTLVTAAIFSGFELAVVLAALWPWRSAYFNTRLAITVLALVAWFITTTPMRELSRLDWVHRRWLAFMVLAVGAVLIARVGYRLVRRITGHLAS